MMNQPRRDSASRFVTTLGAALLILTSLVAQTTSGYGSPLVYAVGAVGPVVTLMPGTRSDGRQLIHGQTKSGGQGGLDLYQATSPDAATKFGNEVALSVFNTAADETMPHVSFTGLEFYFVRRSGCSYSDFYLSTRAATTAAWGAPKKIGAPFDTTGALYSHPTTSDDGLRMYFSMRVGCTGLSRGFVSARTAIGKTWGVPVAFAAVQGPRETGRMVVSNNGQLVWFHGTVLPGGKWGWASTHFDYVTKTWSAPQPMLDLIGVTHLAIDPLTGAMFETHIDNGKLGMFQRFRRVPRLTCPEEPTVSGLVINLSVGWKPVVSQYRIDQGRTFRFVSYPADSSRRNALWAVSPRLASGAPKIPGIEHAFLLDPAIFLVLARTGPSPTGLAELSLTIPKNPALGDLQLYFQSVMYNTTTGAGEFSDPVGLKIAK